MLIKSISSLFVLSIVLYLSLSREALLILYLLISYKYRYLFINSLRSIIVTHCII